MSSARDHDHTAGVKLERFTPGPWDFYCDEDGNVVSILKRVVGNGGGAVGKPICQMPIPNGRPVHQNTARSWDETNANAELIRAAPDLLKSVAAYIAYLDDPAPGTFDVEDALHQDMRAAIAKALGPQTAGESSRADPSPDNLAEKAG